MLPYNLVGISIGFWGSICYSYVKYMQQMRIQKTQEVAKEGAEDKPHREKEKDESSGDEEKTIKTKKKIASPSSSSSGSVVVTVKEIEKTTKPRKDAGGEVSHAV